MSRHRRSVLVALVGVLAVATVVLTSASFRHPVTTSAETGDGSEPTAATAFVWGTPTWSDEFSGDALGPAWNVYDSPGHAGNGLRLPSQVTVGEGMLTQSGTADARSAGMALRDHDEQYGRWEVRMRARQKADPGAQPSHAVLALIPSGIPYSRGAHDIDFAEADIGTGQISLFIHYPPNHQDYLTVPLDLSQWHTFAVEVTPSHISWFVDGVPRATDTRTAAVPGSPMALNVQLDAKQPDGLVPGQLQVDWARFYGLPEGAEVAPPAAPEPVTGEYDPDG